MSFVRLSLLLALLAISFGLPTSYGSHILGLFINGHRSHLLVYMAVVRALLERGHNVTVVTTTHSLEHLTHQYDGMRHIQLPSNTVQIKAQPAKNDFEHVERLLTLIEHSSRFLEDKAWQSFMQENKKYDVMLLGYLFNDYQLGVAAHFNCPVVVIWTGQPVGMINNLIGNPSERTYVTQPYDRDQDKGWKGVAYGLMERVVDLLALRVMHRIYAEHFPSPHYPSLTDLRKNVSLVLCNHHSPSEGPIAPYVPGIVEVGGIQNFYKHPMPLEHTFNSIEREIIYISFGTRAKWSEFPDHIMQTFLQAFKSLSNYAVLWTFEGNCSALTDLSENVICNSWWPQSEILAHPTTKLFITHGGKGSISEAKFYGVPTLGIPLFGDQHANVARIVSDGLGLSMNITSITTGQLISTISELIENSSFSKSAKKFSRRYRDRPQAPDATAVFWIEYVIRHKGAPHLQSPLVHLNFFQYFLIDVYFTLFIVFVLFVKICNWLERKILSF